MRNGYLYFGKMATAIRSVDPKNRTDAQAVSGGVNRVAMVLFLMFEVGGKGKNKRQIANAPDRFLALDNLESGSGQQIPLWLFGFVYGGNVRFENVKINP